ncbi:MAG: hypothetical protein ABSC42_12010, partial [Tepidisphaeraceae bacterium]
MATTMPSDLESWISVAGSCATLIATVVGTSLAIVGFITWRREHVAKRRAELAEETLARIYEAKEAIEYIRAYYCLPHELSARKAEG